MLLERAKMLTHVTLAKEATGLRRGRRRRWVLDLRGCRSPRLAHGISVIGVSIMRHILMLLFSNEFLLEAEARDLDIAEHDGARELAWSRIVRTMLLQKV
jgi:hypothetical protein